MCIGGELGHPNALPSPARKNRALWSALLWRWGKYRELIGRGWWDQPGLKAFGPGWCHEPGPMPPLVPVGGTNRDQRPCGGTGAVRWDVLSHLASREALTVVYKRSCADHFELLSNAGLRAYSVTLCLWGLPGLLRA